MSVLVIINILLADCQNIDIETVTSSTKDIVSRIELSRLTICYIYIYINRCELMEVDANYPSNVFLELRKILA